MNKVQASLSRSFLWTALLLAANFVSRLMVARPVRMLFGDAAGLEPAQTVASWAARAALALAIAAAACIAIPVALRGGSFARRVLNVTPIWLLAIFAIGAIATFMKIGTVGGLAEIEPIGDITFSAAWLLVFGLLTTVVMVPLTARTTLTSRAINLASSLQLPAALAAAAGAAAMIVVLAIVMTTTPAAPGGPGGPPGAPGGAEAAVAQAAMVATTRQELAIGVALIALFGALAARSGLAAWRGRTSIPMESAPAAVGSGGRSELPGAIVAALVLTGIVLIVIQPLRIPVDNPPATEAAVWDSQVTADLVARACMDCHSNEVTWPWYAHVAPSNWLTAGHVRSARGAFNLSELDKLQPDRRASLGERMARSFERGGMPPLDYKRMHPRSELTEAEAAALIEGLKQSLAVD